MSQFRRTTLLSWCVVLFLTCLLGPFCVLLRFGPWWGLASLPIACLVIWKLYPAKTHIYICWIECLLFHGWATTFFFSLGRLVHLSYSRMLTVLLSLWLASFLLWLPVFGIVISRGKRG